MKILSVVGTRPNFIKEVLINRELARRGIQEVLVHTGQHFDFEMSRVFFSEFKIPDPDYHLQVSTGLAGKQIGEMLAALEGIMIKEKPDVTLVYGDVTSTLAGALSSVRLGIPVAHVEAGVRTPARYNPEEINRRATDSLSELLLANCQDAYEALLAENHTGAEIVLSGDIMNDVLMSTIEEFGIVVNRGDYHICTLHRAENVDDRDNLTQIVRAVTQCPDRVVFPVHPRTRKRLMEFNLLDELESAKNVEITEPKGYLGFVKLLAGANKVITDSGGVRREAYILGKPTIVTIDITWFPCLLKAGWKVVAGPDTGRILDAVRDFEPPREHPQFFGDGRAYVKIVDAMDRRFGGLKAPTRQVGGAARI
jgi:UDP-N-acetylglucosamine 2-epimerase (non-hydrolysing)